jgi:hypothetical protein
MGSPITADQIKALVVAWYRALDNHDPIEACNAMLADKGLVMKFPDGDIKDLASFKTWYDRVTNIFFDENHYVQTVEPRINGDVADVRVCVGWQASVWEPPAAKSKRVALDATQQWKVCRSNRNPCGVVITFYDATAEPFKYAPGFAHL